jgi:Ca-activated chloride channel homolog
MGLAVSVALDVRSVRPNQPTRAHLVVVLSATRDENEGQREPRIPSRTILAIDASRSMHGEPLDHVKASVRRMVDMFAADDEVGVVAFSDNASQVCAPIKMDETGKRLVRERVARLGVSANTNIQAGLDMAALLLAAAPDGMRRGGVLLSDGAPNRGAHTAEGLREIAKRHRSYGISFFALGYGRDHSEDVLSAVGDAGGGGYEYVPDPVTCSRAFARALGAQADVVASGIEIVIGLADGVEIGRFVGSEEMRVGKDGVIVTLPDMVAGARRVIVAEITVAAPGTEKFLAHVADVTVRLQKGLVAKPAEGIDVEVADRDPVVDAIGMREVLLARADLARTEARQLADSGHFVPAAVALRKLLAHIERCPGFVLNDGSVLAEAYEQVVDEAVAYERKPALEEYREMRKTTMGLRFTASAPESARNRGPMSTRFLEGVAGNMPEAYLVVGDIRHRLREENVIGRTQGADIVVTCSQVTRRQAGVNAIDGKFVIVDYGATNPTLVNGSPIRMHILKNGDVIRVGTVDIRYEQVGD